MSIIIRETTVKQDPESSHVKVNLEIDLDNKQQASELLTFIANKTSELNSGSNTNIVGDLVDIK